MKKFFKKIQRKDMILGWESRGKWLAQEIKHICEELDLLDVVDPFIRDPLSGRIFYFRLHGGKGYRHKFSDDELASLAKKNRKVIHQRWLCNVQ